MPLSFSRASAATLAADRRARATDERAFCLRRPKRGVKCRWISSCVSCVMCVRR